MSLRAFFNELVLGANALRSSAVVVTLTNAQIKALPTTPITLVAGQGSGFRICIESVSMQLEASAAAYTNINATYSVLQLTYAGDTSWLTNPIANDTTVNQLQVFLGTASDKVWQGTCLLEGRNYGPSPGFGEYVIGQALATSVTNNTAVQISMDNNGSGVLTGGNAANFLRVRVLFHVEPIA
jgi:hypothetical protein